MKTVQLTETMFQCLMLLDSFYSTYPSSYVSPTDVGKVYTKHGSAWSSPKLNKLVNMGYAKKNKSNHYTITTAGLLKVKKLALGIDTYK